MASPHSWRSTMRSASAQALVPERQAANVPQAALDIRPMCTWEAELSEQSNDSIQPPSQSEREASTSGVNDHESYPDLDEPSISTEFKPEGRVVLILCGFIASGKSTFAESLQSHFPQFVRCSQDDLGDRRKVEQLTRQSLSQGDSVCVDRTNINASQRSTWIKIAREFAGTKVWVIMFDAPYELCAARLQHRTGHPTITSPELGLSVLSRFASEFEAPGAHEGYDRILYLKPSDYPDPEYSRTDISAILHRVRDSNPVAAAAGTGLAAGSSRGFPGNSHSYRGPQGRGRPHRGSWRGRGVPNVYGNPRQGVPPPPPTTTTTARLGGYVPLGVSTGFRGWNSARVNNGDPSTGYTYGRGGASYSGARGQSSNNQTGSASSEIGGGRTEVD